MRIEQTKWTSEAGYQPEPPGRLDTADLVLVFGSTAILADAGRRRELVKAYPAARIVGCSTAGEICGTRVSDDSLVATAVRFEHTRIAVATEPIAAPACKASGARLARALPADGLVHVLVLSAGLGVNGTELVAGLVESLPPGVAVTGGLAGDGARFQETLVMLDGAADGGSVVAVGFYGPRLRVGYGSLGGWDSFGPERRITRSSGNVLYELDGHPALELYKRYLGAHAEGLPATGLLFPLNLRTNSHGGVVRTILAVNEAEGSMTFAGDMPTGAHARLMRANFDRLVDGATGASRASQQALGDRTAELAILISCVGRKLVLKQRVEEEVEGVRGVLGPGAALAGYYSYGELSPSVSCGKCELHNQTMTITTLAEV